MWTFPSATMWYCQLAGLKTPLCVTWRRFWHRKAIVMIDCGHMWRLWSGYIAALTGITLDIGELNKRRVVFYLIFIRERQQHFNYSSLLLITRGWMEMILRCCYIVYREGQSRVCTRLFRWWFTYILSSWVIEWLSHFPFMRKVAIYGPCA